MRLGEAPMGVCVGACAAIALASPPVRADEPPLPPITEARPPVPAAPEPAPVPWQHHVDVGGGLAISELPTSVDGDGNRTPVRIKPGVGFHFDLDWQVFRYLRFTGYMVEHFHALDLPTGSLGVPGTISPASMHGYSFGVRFSPTLPIGPRVRLWLTAGAGWGYLGYPTLTVDATSACSAASTCVTLRDRSSTLFEIPMGVGAAIDVIPRWLSIRVELTGAVVPSQTGDALDHGQYIGADHLIHDLLPMPKLDASFVQTLGLALHL